MQTVNISHVAEYVDEEVKIAGWVYNKRSSGSVIFLILRDGTGFIQAVAVKGEISDGDFQTCDELTQESSVVISGKVRADKRAPGGFELAVTGIEVVQIADEYPISLKKHGVDFLMERRHLWLRTPRQTAILRIRHEVIKAIRDFFDEQGFVLIDAPILTPSACEGTTTLFSTEYFDSTAYLSQSGQLYMEAAAMALGKVYCFGPTFRAEKSKTRRHLTEFWMVEPEMAWVDLDGNLKVQEELVSYVIQRVLEEKKNELETIKRDTGRLENIKPPFPRISYDEAVEILHKCGVEFEWGNDFGGGDETVLAEQFELPVFVHRYPSSVKAFYMKPDPERPEVCLSADLLAPEGYGEIIGGGQRIDDLELLASRIKEHNLPEEAYEWYMGLRRYGSVPHSGFGLGIERFVAWICGLDHVRETIPFPRLLNRIYP
ncbi:MAG: asparagine--tRNA ligase [Bacillota bacterium]|nr:asparagine--tRNA ligase [Bacillota bacterium]MDI9415649.1 asparagine--tRNA ligase [Bacillota bacterium]NLD12778.1 asparagine--tRNA ligase [Bacillota bacterium]HOB88605.1 asparagine--tRNA ligase [Bacillota bacterium]HOJ58320.1 asparagine--tRNA ligase [Bacillota bacterium]